MSSIDVSLGGTWSHHRTGSAPDAGDDVEGGSAQKQQEPLLEQEKRRQAEKERLKKDKGILKDKVLRLLALASLNEWRVVEVKLDQARGVLVNVCLLLLPIPRPGPPVMDIVSNTVSLPPHHPLFPNVHDMTLQCWVENNT